MSIQSVMNKRLEYFYKSQKVFENVTRELSIAKDPVLSHIPPSFRYDTAAIQFTNPSPSTIMFKEVYGTHCHCVPPTLKELYSSLITRNSIPNTNWIGISPRLEESANGAYLTSASRNYYKNIHNSQTSGNIYYNYDTYIKTMLSKIEKTVRPENRFESFAHENTNAIGHISSPLWNAMGLVCGNAAFRILPHTIKYKNGPHIPYNATYIGLPIGTTFTVRNRNNKRDWITYKIVGKLINFEETPRHLTQAQVQAHTGTDPDKYLPTDTYAKQLTNHLIVKPIDTNETIMSATSRGLKWSAIARKLAITCEEMESEPVYNANGYLTMNRHHIREWLVSTYKCATKDLDNDTVILDGSTPSNKGSNSSVAMRDIMAQQQKYNEFNIIPDTLDLFIDGNPLDDHVVYSVDRTTISIPEVDFTETDTYKNISSLSTIIPNYVCRLVFDSPGNCYIDEDVYNFFY